MPLMPAVFKMAGVLLLLENLNSYLMGIAFYT